LAEREMREVYCFSRRLTGQFEWKNFHAWIQQTTNKLKGFKFTTLPGV